MIADNEMNAVTSIVHQLVIILNLQIKAVYRHVRMKALKINEQGVEIFSVST